MKRTLPGTAAALASMAIATGVMLPLRDNLSIGHATVQIETTACDDDCTQLRLRPAP